MGAMRRVLSAAVIFMGAQVVAQWGAAVALGQAALAQDPDISRQLEQVRRETRLLATPDLSAGDRAILDYGAFLTLSYFSTDTSAGDNRALWQTDLNLYARINLDGAHEFYVRDRIQYREYNTGDETATDQDGVQNFLEEAYYKFDLARYLAAYHGESSPNDLTVTVGRQFVNWESGLVLAQYLDGGKADISVGPFGATLLAGVTTYGTTDFDTSRPDYDKSTYRGFFGGEASVQLGTHRPFVYFLAQRDYNQDRNLTIAGATAEFRYNSNYIGIGSNGSFTDHIHYLAEAVYEFGSDLSAPFLIGSTSAQSEEPIQAWAGLAELDYLFNDARHSKVGLTGIIASGDHDRGSTNATLNGNSTGTHDNAFNSLGIVSAGYAFSPPISNLVVLKTSGTTFPMGDLTGPLSRLQLGSDLLFFGKAESHGQIDETTSDGQRFLGTELDLYANWRILEDVTFQVRYGIFFPGTTIQSDQTRQFVYTSLTYSF